MSSYEPLEESDQTTGRNVPIERYHETQIYGTESDAKGDGGNIVSKISGLQIGLDFTKHRLSKDRSRSASRHRRSDSAAEDDKRKPSLKPETEGDIHAKLYNACLTGNLSVVKDILDKHYTTLMPDEDGQTPLYAACIGNQPEIVKYLIRRGYDVNHQDKNGKTPLHIAYEWKEMGIVELLLKFNASTSIRDNRQWTSCHLSIDTGHYGISPVVLRKFFEADIGTDVAWIQLHAACYVGDLDKIKILLAAGTDIHCTSSIGYTPLHVACSEKNRPEVVRYLLENGANKNIQCAVFNGLFPLHMACAKAGSGVIQDLLENGADPNGTIGGVPAAHLAVDFNNYEAIQCLAAWPATDLNAVDEAGDTCLHRAVNERNLNIVTFLLQKEVKVNCVNYHCLTPLHLAIYKNEIRIIEKLLAAKADPNIRDANGDSSLMLALNRKQQGVTEMLLDAGAKVEATNNDGDTCLHLAVTNGCSLQTVQVLIQHTGAINNLNKHVQTPLILACAKNQRDVVDLLLTSGADPMIADKRGDTCLHWVVVHKGCDGSIVQALVERGADLDATDNSGRTALRCACAARCWDNMITLLNAGANPNIQDAYGDTLLQTAVHKYGTPEILQALIVNGVPVNSQNNYLLTAIHIACMVRQTSTVKVLLELGADPNITDPIGSTALHLAAIYDCDAETVRHLVQHGAEVNKVNEKSDTAMLIACSRKNDEFVGELLKLRGDPNIPDAEGETCLHHAVHQTCGKKILQDLIANGADLDTLDHRHRTVLLLACCNENLSAIDMLLNAGANPNITDAKGNSILHTAIHQRLSTQTLQTIIDHGAHLDALNEDQLTALDLACISKQIDSARILVRNGANQNVSGYRCIHEAVRKGNAELVEVLCSHPLDINAVNDQQQTALYMACVTGQHRIANILMDKGADLNKPNPLLNTPLHMAVKNDEVDIIGDLLEHGADANMMGQHGFTPLHVAVSYGSEVCMKAILRYKPDMNIQDNEGNTPLTKACKMGLHTLVLLLVQHGADTQLENSDGHCAFYYAVKHGDRSMMEALIDGDPSVLNTMIGENGTVLHYFCRKGKADIVKWLVRCTVDKDKICREGSPLDVAHKNGHKHIVFMLIDAGADVSRTKSVSRLGFMDKIYQQRHLHMDTLEHMILSDKCRADLTAVNEDHETLLLQACRDGAVDVVDAMLESTKDPGINICNKFGKSPVTIACENVEKLQGDSVTVLSMLLRNKRPVNLRSADYTGMTALHIVTKHNSIMMVNMLLHACQELANTTDAMGRTPLHFAKSSQVVNLLVKRGADVNHRDFLGRTPLLYCVEHGHHEAAAALIKLQPDAMNMQDNMGRTVLHLCVPSKALDVVKDTRGLQVNSVTINKQSALHLAVAKGDVERTEQLLQMGTDPSVMDKNHLSPLHLAANQKCWELLIKHKGLVSVLSRLGYSTDDMKQWFMHLEEIKTKELWPKIIVQGYDVLHEIMKMPFLGLSNANELHKNEQQVIGSQLKQLMSKLRQEVQQSDPLLAFEVKPVGSFQDGTSVGLPDEAGFVCLLDKVPEMLQPPKKLPYSNTNVALSIKSDFSGDRPNFVDHNGDVMTQVLLHRFSNAILRALAVPGIWEDFPQLYLVNVLSEPELKLHLIWHGTVYKWLPISVHIELGLVFPDWQPSWIEARHADIAKRCFILFKNITHVEESKRSICQISFAEAEEELLTRMPPELKAGFQLAKLMRHPCICSPLKISLKQNASSVISEQMLKTITFHLYEESLTSDKLLDVAGISHVIRAAQLIYERLAAALSQKVLRMFMLPSHNVLLDHFQGPRSYEERELARQYCRKISNLLQKHPNPNLV